MRTTLRLLTLTALALSAGLSCGGDDGAEAESEAEAEAESEAESEGESECPVGAEGCPCTRGGACDPGLACRSDLCVDLGIEGESEAEAEGESEAEGEGESEAEGEGGGEACSDSQCEMVFPFCQAIHPELPHDCGLCSCMVPCMEQSEMEFCDCFAAGCEGEGESEEERGGYPIDFRAEVPGGGEGVTVDPTGYLLLDPEEPLRIFRYIWIANTGEHTVSKLDTETGQELGRYRTGPGGDDPACTGVGLNGDVVVGNRGGNAAVRIHADVETCPDRDGNGVIDTSIGPPGDVLPWDADGDGQPDDECVLWYTPLPGAYVRAVAFDYQVGADGDLSSNVWIGGWDTRTLYRLDAVTGEVTEQMVIPASPYGMAFDGEGSLWVQARGAGMLIQVNTETLAVTIHPADGEGYGITVDAEGRPVIATDGTRHVNRFDPATNMWATADLPDNGRGVAVARDGAIWAVGHDTGIFRIDPDTMTVTDTVVVGCCAPHVGAAVDQAGRVWVVSEGGSRAYRIDPETFAVAEFPVGSGPYSLGDMTGAHLENAGPALGRLTSILEGCGLEQQWTRLEWDADTPGGTWVRFRARTAAARAGLGDAPWTILAEQPDDASPVDLIPILDAPGASGSFGGVMQLEISMGAVQPGITPRVRDVRLHTTCAP